MLCIKNKKREIILQDETSRVWGYAGLIIIIFQLRCQNDIST
jgi:hypothetical protein